MKSELFFALIFLLLLPAAIAEISTDGPYQSYYNLGEKVSVNGKILLTEEFEGDLKVSIECNNESVQLSSNTVEINAEESYPFSKKLSIPPAVSGECSFAVSLVNSGGVLEEVTSKTFTITDELNGVFSAEKAGVQLGENLNIEGRVYYKNSEPATGIAVLYFKKDGKNIFIDSTSISNGKMGYSFETLSREGGRYTVDISVNDIYGNKLFSEDEIGFAISDSLNIGAYLETPVVAPGEEFRVNGVVKTELGEMINVAVVRLFLGDDVFVEDVTHGSFSSVLFTPKNTKSGDHNIRIEAEDNYGNKGSLNINVEVEQVPTKLDIELNKASYIPEEELKIGIYLYDQADDPMEDDSFVDMYNPNEKLIFSNGVKTNKELNVVIPKFSIPGTYNVIVTSSGLEEEEKFIVSSYEALGIIYENMILRITNAGNVPYKKPIEITLSNSERNTTITKDLDLDVNETIEINLAKEAPTGTYDISISYVADSVTEEGVPKQVDIIDQRSIFAKAAAPLVGITGKAVGIKDTKKSYWFALFLIVFLISAAFLLKGGIKLKKELPLKDADEERKKEINQMLDTTFITKKEKGRQ